MDQPRRRSRQVDGLQLHVLGFQPFVADVKQETGHRQTDQQADVAEEAQVAGPVKIVPLAQPVVEQEHRRGQQQVSPGQPPKQAAAGQVAQHQRPQQEFIGRNRGRAHHSHGTGREGKLQTYAERGVEIVHPEGLEHQQEHCQKPADRQREQPLVTRYVEVVREIVLRRFGRGHGGQCILAKWSESILTISAWSENPLAQMNQGV